MLEAFNNLCLTPPVATPADSIPREVSPRADTALTNERSGKRKSPCLDDETPAGSDSSEAEEEIPPKSNAPHKKLPKTVEECVTDIVGRWVLPLRKKRETKKKKKKARTTEEKKGALELKRDPSDSWETRFEVFRATRSIDDLFKYAKGAGYGGQWLSRSAEFLVVCYMLYLVESNTKIDGKSQTAYRWINGARVALKIINAVYETCGRKALVLLNALLCKSYPEHRRCC